jgi:cAMP-dependent protein kinase regulator
MSVVEGLPFAEDKKKYIVETLDPILEEMVSDVLTEMPKSPLDFMVQWLRKRSGTAASQKIAVKAKNILLKQELKQLTGSLQEAGTVMDKHEEHEEESEEEDDDDELDEIPEHMLKSEAQLGRARQSVSAEAYGAWNQKKAITAPKNPKSAEQMDRLRQTLQKSFMFSDLDSSDMETIVLAMKEAKFDDGQKVITEREDGDYLFVVEVGALDCIKVIEDAEKVVKTCNAGDVFGELALLYNCPRAASVVAKGACTCWQLDRETFNHIVKDAAVKRRNKYDNFLKQVALLNSLGAYERSQVADCLKTEIFTKDDTIVKQDEPGDKFYIVEEGSLFALKNGADGEKRVMDYKAGDYFGELALLKNQPRAASVKVSSDMAKVLSMSRLSFNKMLGPLQQILAKQADQYK